jgi:tetratricopeptide (TPR) repeat protein
MKVLKSLIALLVVVVVIGLFIPADLRGGWFYYLYGRTLDLTGNSEGAVDAYKMSTESLPDDVRFARMYARALNDVAEETDDEGMYVSAYNFAHEFIDNHENDDGIWQLYIEQARADWGRGRRNNAKAAIDLAVNMRPTDYEALVYQGIIYRDIQPTREQAIRLSIPIFEQAIQVRNQTRTYWAEYELARAWWMVHDETRALNELNQSLSQFPPRWLRDDAERLKQEILSSGRTEH